FEKTKPAKLVQHPLYDTFGAPVPATEARQKLDLPQDRRILLFFGFIRKYKGLDLLIRAMAEPELRRTDALLLVAGEFYEEEAPYRELIRQLGLQDRIIVRSQFIPDSEVRYYLCAADCVVQPYRDATQSGVTPLAYHFEKPMIVTNVGGLPSLVPHERVGLVCAPEPPSIASAIRRFYQLGEAFFIPHLRSEKLKYSWSKLVEAIRELE
ncbi:MAG TPA: glycosyltransferase, partial [Chitinophagaceae bacterium]|nr:glycosyltransferase [Chitinophagaceae bacterium]